ncbi:MAG: L-rhamnose isomerase [Clostridia bacterium]|jgi:L-rhamnose isomerase|nr:L-rhamnose isomerase [Clostridia bacterium]
MLNTEKALEIARNVYGKYGVDVDAALKATASTPVSIHCWQGDDVAGFEAADGDLTGGIQSTGNYPGKARNIDELRKDFEFAKSLIPGKKKFALHAIYLDSNGKKVARNEIGPEHFTSWIDWAKEQGLGLDYNPTFFSHPLSADGFTLSSDDEGIRKFWVEHGILSRKVSEAFGKATGQPSVINFWVPDGFKDIPVNRKRKRENLARSYDEIFAEKISKDYNLDAVESKLFGIGLESCTIGSHEFYMGCAMKHNVLLTLDTGHFHPTEMVSDKLSSTLQYLDGVMLHVSRPVRWDSDHVVILDDELKAIACEIHRGGYERRVNIGLDFFDGSINRIAAWTMGTRNMQKALLWANLEPVEMLQKFELEGDYTSRLAYLEELKTLPFGLVWNAYCDMQGVPAGDSWIPMMKKYEADVLSAR